jgi:hypothetical protein
MALVFVLSSAGTMPGWAQKPALPAGPDPLIKLGEDFYTVTDYAAGEPADEAARAARLVRAKRYNLPVQKGVDPRRFMLTEERNSAFGTYSSHAPVEPALPFTQSSAILLGEVIKAEAFLSADKTTIISEFTIKTAEILKNDSALPIAVGDPVTAIRGGGGVRFPSGKIILMGMHGKPLPRLGKRYLFFLKYNKDEGRDFDIITGYELADGKVLPLDGEGPTTGAYGQYATYLGRDEWDFLNEVRVGIAK